MLAKLRRRISKKYRVIYKRGPSTVAAVFAGLAVIAWVVFLGLSGYPIAAYAYYTVLPKTSNLLSQALSQTAQQAERPLSTPKPVDLPVEPTGLPEKNVSLPEGHYLTIPKIGVDTVIWDGEYSEYEKLLRHGVWRVPDFSLPDKKEEGKPVILVAHRFGYLDWTQEYREQNSFFNLPELTAGDEIEVMWEQRKYRYVVERVEEGREIGNYEADLILYTCKFYVSPIRIFVYARLVL